MASLCAAARPLSQAILGFHRPSGRPNILTTDVLKLSPASFDLRLRNTTRLETRQRLFIVSASNSIPPGDSIKKESSEKKTSDAAQGPPFLTILAGFLVFLLVCWIFGSIIIGLIGLIVVPPK